MIKDTEFVLKLLREYGMADAAQILAARNAALESGSDDAVAELIKAGVVDADELLNWIHQYRDSRVFVHSKFDSYFECIKKVLSEKRQWLHFDLDWEDEYIKKHRSMLN